MEFKNNKIIFVSGKGGVGKSTVAAAIAHREAQRGRKVLLVELGESSFYKEFFELQEVGFKPRVLSENLWVSRWDGESALHDYVLYFIKLEKLYKLFFENRVMKAFIQVAPSVAEISILGKLTSGVRKVGPPLDFDLIVVDAYSTGHFLALLRAPRGLSEIIKTGPFGVESRDINKVLNDQVTTAYVVVTLAEPLPVSETHDLVKILKQEFHSKPLIICNKVLNNYLPSDSQVKRMMGLIEDNSLEESKSFLIYLNYLRTRQEQYLEELKSKYPNLVLAPWVFKVKDKLSLIKRIAQEWK